MRKRKGSIEIDEAKVTVNYCSSQSDSTTISLTELIDEIVTEIVNENELRLIDEYIKRVDRLNKEGVTVSDDLVPPESSTLEAKNIKIVPINEDFGEALQYHTSEILQRMEECNVSGVKMQGMKRELESIKEKLENLYEVEITGMGHGVDDMGFHDWSAKDITQSRELIRRIENQALDLYALVLKGMGYQWP